MVGASPTFDIVGTLSLRSVRRFIGASGAWSLAVLLGGLYLFGSLLEGGMLGFAHLGGGYTITIITGSGTGQGWWNYPAVIVAAPWGYVNLPFFTGVSMLLVAIGVGVGMAVAVLLALQILRPTAAGAARSKAVGTVTGLTPAMIGLVTLGACCSTTAAASAGVGLVAQASGSSVSNLLLNDWYLGVFQLVVVWAALLAQELLLGVYGGLFGLDGYPATGADAGPSAKGLRYVAGAGLRAVLVAGGLLWILALFAEWTTVSPSTAGPGLWFQWLGQHLLLGGLAILAGFFPRGMLRLLERSQRGWYRVVPVATVLTGASLVAWLPPFLVAAGFDSLANQILAAVGASPGWAPIDPGPSGGPALWARWCLEYAAVAGFAIAASLWPRRALGLMVATMSRGATGGSVAPSAALAAAPLSLASPDERPDLRPSAGTARGEP